MNLCPLSLSLSVVVPTRKPMNRNGKDNPERIRVCLSKTCCGLVLKLNSAKRLFFMNMINDEEATGEDSSFIFHVANLYF